MKNLSYIREFSLEPEENLSCHDYVVIYDGTSMSAKSLGKYFVIGLIDHSWGHLDSTNHVYPHLAI